MNKKSKGEQFFILLLLLSAMFIILCLTGCGSKQSCETPKFGKEEIGESKAIGCSLPGLGGCLTPQKGCNCSCYAQSCKIIHFSKNEDDVETTDDYDMLKITACDNRYYDGGRLGCNYTQKSCYGGCIKFQEEDAKANGFFYGSSDCSESIIGRYNGCGGCLPFERIGSGIILELEELTGIN